MRRKPQSLDAVRAEQLAETERRLRAFLEAEESRIERTLFGNLDRNEDPQWHAKSVLFEVCVMISLQRSQDMRAFVSAALRGIGEETPPRKHAPVGRKLVLQCLAMTG